MSRSPVPVHVIMRVVRRRWAARSLVTLVMATLALPATAAADPLAGTLSFGGYLSLTDAYLSFGCPAVDPDCAIGDFMIGPALVQSGSFALLGSTSGAIQRLATASGTTPIINFLTLNASPGQRFDLTHVLPGVYPACVPPAYANPCTPPGSVLDLGNTATGAAIAFSVAGRATAFTGEISSFLGTFTTQLTSTPGTTDRSVAELLAWLAAGETVTMQYSATVVVVPGIVPVVVPIQQTTTPEPGTLALLASGLAGLAGVVAARRQRRVRGVRSTAALAATPPWPRRTTSVALAP